MKYFLLIITLIFVSLSLFAYPYFGLDKKNTPTLHSEKSKKTPSYELVEIARGLNVPWSIVFTSKTRALISERYGAIRAVENGILLKNPLITISDVDATGEDGLMSLALHPDYDRNDFVYASYSYKKNNATYVKVVRFIDMRSRLILDKTIIDDIPGASFHSGTRIKFGPDGKLYVTTGDASQKQNAQDPHSLSGKVLCMDDDGGAMYIYARGLRNSQGIDWDPVSGTLWGTDHGPSGFDGPFGGDEINRIVKNGNYGWPLVHHEMKMKDMIFPMLLFTPSIAPSGLTFYQGNRLSEYKNDLFFAGLKGEGIYHATLTKDRTQIKGWEKLPYVNVGRVRDIIEGPDGYLYFTTSNRDGRGTQREGDDKVYKIIQK